MRFQFQSLSVIHQIVCNMQGNRQRVPEPSHQCKISAQNGTSYNWSQTNDRQTRVC